MGADAERSFRVDRILGASLLDERAARHRVAGTRRHFARSSPGPRGSGAGGVPALLELSPSGRWLVEQVPHEGVTELADGTLRVALRGRDRAWLVSLVLSAGAHLRHVEPTWLAQEASTAAEQALRAYGAGTTGTGVCAGPVPARSHGRDVAPSTPSVEP